MSRKLLFMISSFFFVFGFLLLFHLPSPAYAACEPPGPGWQCKLQPIYGNCPYLYCTNPRDSCPFWLGCVDCGGELCKLTDCKIGTYRCITGWECVCIPPAGGCNGLTCPPGTTCVDGQCVSGDGSDGGPSCGACRTKADCDPCGSGYDCIEGACTPQCQQAGSGTKCNPQAPNNGCPSGERCCWGVGECYLFCCSGGGYSPDPPAGYITLSPQVDTAPIKRPLPTGKDYKYRFTPMYARFGEEAKSCYFGMEAWGGDKACKWKKKNWTARRPYEGNYILAYHGPDYVLSTNDDKYAGPSSSFRFRAPANWLIRAVEFDWYNNTNRSSFYVARYVRRTIAGHPSGEAIPATLDGQDGNMGVYESWSKYFSTYVKKGHRKIYMQPASREFWLVFKIIPKKKYDLAYGGWNKAYIYNIKLHLIKVNKTEEKTIDVISNVYEPGVTPQPHHIERVRFTNECPLGPKNDITGGCCDGTQCRWSGWVPIASLSNESLFGYSWPLGNPTRTVWMHACTKYDLCKVFKDSIKYNPYGTVAGYIWNDLNNNDGTGKDPPTEPNYTASKVTVSYSCPSGSGSKNTSDGNYSFSNVPAGESCSISISGLDSPWTITPACKQSGKCDSPQTFTVSAGGTTTVNFGVWKNPPAWFQGVNGDIYGLGVNVSVPGPIGGNCYVKSGYGCWFLAADPGTSGGVVISGNATLSCSGRCSERGSLPGWNVKNQTIAWPSSLKFSAPSDAINISTVFSYPAAPQFTLQKGKSYIWDFPSTHSYFKKIHWNPRWQGYRVTGVGHRVAAIYVPASQTPFTIHPRFQAYKADGTPGGSNRQGVIFVVDGDVRINRNPVARPLNDSAPNLQAMVIAKGTITVFGTRDDRRRIVKGMLYGKGGIRVTGEELEDNLYPRLLTIYNALYHHPSNPLRKNSIKWREITP